MGDCEAVSFFAGMAREDNAELIQSVDDDGTRFFIIQVPNALVPNSAAEVPYHGLDIVAGFEVEQFGHALGETVSYTHLTLPTKA